MDNTQGAELKREALMKVLTGDEIGVAMTTALLQTGLIRNRAKKVGMSYWLTGSVTEYELTEKGLERLNGI